MQGRMKQHQLTADEIAELLSSEQVGRLATLDPDGTPYVVPVHFVYHGGKIYIHGLIKGQKIANILASPHVCFEVDRMYGLVMAEEPCDVNTAYRSVVIKGEARLVEDTRRKIEVLGLVVAKYAPALSGREFPARMLGATSVIEIDVLECTGKYFKG